MMKPLIEGFSKQLAEALEIAAKAELIQPAVPVSNVVIAGMGGSGIGGNLVTHWTADSIKVPITISKNYTIPAFVNANTLFIACSFSGNTEETLAAAEKAKEKGAKIVAITSGGKMGEFASDNGYDTIKIPGHSGSPRASIGYSFVQILKVLNTFGLTDSDFAADFREAIELVNNEQESINADAKALAAKIKGNFLFLYSEAKFEGVVLRTQQQIAENSKHMSHCNVFPEMNHNELVGWAHPAELFQKSVTVVLRSHFDNPRNASRIDICLDIFRKISPTVEEIHGKGTTLIAQSVYFIHLLDWVSFYLAEENNVDPFPVDVINFLKDELAKIK